MRRVFAIVFSLSFLLLPVRGAETKYAALTFDDGPSGKYTRQLLDGLYDRGVQATFLLCGYRMKEYPDITQRIFDEGHEIGFHGYSHKSMKGLSRRDIAAELVDSQALLPDGCQPVFLRPPGGGCSDGVLQVAQARNLAILSWSVDPRDWATDDTRAIETAVLDKIRDGDIVLLHDMTASSVKASLDIVDRLLAEDFELVTVSELARLRLVKPKPGQVYTCFPKKEEDVK
ncbi:MAG: polysaccharide deacetylase family protein [Oscillospiraceae bacterium]|nr:polysaccharide deacetylase family protein [Oscillospiraceae bacterium]